VLMYVGECNVVGLCTSCGGTGRRFAVEIGGIPFSKWRVGSCWGFFEGERGDIWGGVC
jgi:hypothetical protein